MQAKEKIHNAVISHIQDRTRNNTAATYLHSIPTNIISENALAQYTSAVYFRIIVFCRKTIDVYGQKSNDFSDKI